MLKVKNLHDKIEITELFIKRGDLISSLCSSFIIHHTVRATDRLVDDFKGDTFFKPTFHSSLDPQKKKKRVM